MQSSPLVGFFSPYNFIRHRYWVGGVDATPSNTSLCGTIFSVWPGFSPMFQHNRIILKGPFFFKGSSFFRKNTTSSPIRIASQIHPQGGESESKAKPQRFRSFRQLVVQNHVTKLTKPQKHLPNKTRCLDLGSLVVFLVVFGTPKARNQLINTTTTRFPTPKLIHRIPFPNALPNPWNACVWSAMVIANTMPLRNGAAR